MDQIDPLDAIIGLEIHAQMNTRTKMFCGCSNDAYGVPPNTLICPICTGHPGTLPVPNREAIFKAIRMALALHCTVQEHCHFDRKHYFYPDLPLGFQISQYDFPLARSGVVQYDIIDHSGNATSSHECRIHRLHIENDAGKLTHRGTHTLCDFNRAGTPLMEIVTEPDLGSARHAVAFAQELRRMLIAAHASDADMFKGMMRFDASISLREKGSTVLNPRSEIKNLNSFKALEQALTYEEKRLRLVWEKEGGPLHHNITVGWLDDEGKTRLLRDKEEAADYRYFPEPDIPPMHFTRKDIQALQKDLPPPPREQKEALIKLGLTHSEARELIDEPQLRLRFDAIFKKTADAKRSSGIILTQLQGFLNAAEKNVADAPPLEHLLELVEHIDNGTVSANTGKEILQKMVETGKPPSAIIKSEGLENITDDRALEAIIQQAIAANPQAIDSLKKGKEAALGAIVGWVMKESKGKADPRKVSDLLKKILK
ncbi:Asp-tRNA(Asn)/Glu-tRNA(Gln) amidotransferase subunit GatB [Candidatus Peregrinibacteria bacterium]|nr:Asp-tRNA(Asn)/Glu-tRNA(Gln) amidotransferase subunit GatB [Candidatus Peregrinibacteria bacterium]